MSLSGDSWIPTPARARSAARAPATVDRRSIEASLRALEAEVHARMSREERPGGLFATVIHAAPRYLTFIERLRAQHRNILLEVRALARRARAAADDEVEALQRARQALLDTIADHHALEREVLRDALEP
jgi:hypothetical protein